MNKAKKLPVKLIAGPMQHDSAQTEGLRLTRKFICSSNKAHVILGNSLIVCCPECNLFWRRRDVD